MKTIEIEDDVYQYLLQNAIRIGESASEILIRLLKIQKKGIDTNRPVEGPNTEILEFINSDYFRAQSNIVNKFICFLSFLYQKNPDKFEKVPITIYGRNRKYFGKSREELENSGRSVFPQKIWKSPFWVATNNDTSKKRRMLRDVLRLLGYNDEDVKHAVEALA